jgi:hypothetical protein
MLDWLRASTVLRSAWLLDSVKESASALGPESVSASEPAWESELDSETASGCSPVWATHSAKDSRLGTARDWNQVKELDPQRAVHLHR